MEIVKSEDLFLSPENLAGWSATILSKRGLDEIADWRMLEYWVQCELYRAIQTGQAGTRQHLGQYEQPYCTALPVLGKYKWKWADLVVAEPNLKQAERIIWIELKDTGRSEERLRDNSRGLGRDAAALYALDSKETINGWRKSPEHVKDKGRREEWMELANVIEKSTHSAAQITIVPLKLVEEHEEIVQENWLWAFYNKVKQIGVTETNIKLKIARCNTEKFAIFATLYNIPDRK